MEFMNFFKKQDKCEPVKIITTQIPEDKKKIEELTISLQEARKTIEYLAGELDKQIVNFHLPIQKPIEEKPRIVKRKKIKTFDKIYDEMAQIGFINSKEADKLFNGYAGIATTYASKGLKHLKRGRLYFFKKEDIEDFIKKYCRTNIY